MADPRGGSSDSSGASSFLDFMKEVVNKPGSYLVMLVGFMAGIIFLGLASWGYFGDQVRTSALDFLDSSGRADLSRQVAAAKQSLELEKNRSNEISEKLNSAEKRATKAEEELAKIAPIPLEVKARFLGSDFLRFNSRIILRNTGSKDLEFVFGPGNPELEFAGVGKFDARTTSKGGCPYGNSCFRSQSSVPPSLVLQPGSTSVVDLEFSTSNMPTNPVNLLDRMFLSLPIWTSDGKQTRLSVSFSDQ